MGERARAALDRRRHRARRGDRAGARLDHRPPGDGGRASIRSPPRCSGWWSAALCLSLLIRLPIRGGRGQKAPLTPGLAAQTALVAFLGLGVGMTLLLFALAGGKVGIVSTLSATSPAIILPMIWARTGERPAAGAWAGAALVVAGMALIFAR